jgi:exosortase
MPELLNRASEDLAARFLSQAASRPRARWWQAAVLALLIGSLYSDILLRLAAHWRRDPNFSHGFFVLVFSGFAIWRERRRLAALAVAPSWLGLEVKAGALAMIIVGVLGAELFLSRASLVVLLAGLALYFLGWGHFRALLFPWAFLFFMIPIPAILFNQIAFPLQLLASQFASSLISLLGVPVLREGNVIRLPSMALEVAEACSGIRSLMSLGALAIIYGYFLEAGILRRVLLVVAAVPIAVVANALRVMGTGLLGQYWSPEKAEGFFHTFSGWVIFLLSLGMLFLLHGAMRLVERRQALRRT